MRRPTVVVAGDDRAARDLAADLRAWLRPRPVRFYPSRGVAYESHLAPPAAPRRACASPRWTRILEASPGQEAPVVVVSAVALSEKVPDPELRPHGFTLEVGELLDLDETILKLVAAGYERVDQVEDRGQFAVRGGLLDIYPATEERAVRVELFDIEIESLRWFSTFTQRSLGEAKRVEIAPAAELAAEHRELAEIAALEDEESRPDVAELLPVDRFRELLGLLPEHTDVVIAADEDLEPALRDHWDDVCAAFHDTDAHHLYVKPDDITAALEATQPAAPLLDLRLAADRVPRPGRRVRRALARPRPSRSSRSSRAPATRRVVDLAAARPGRARRLQPAAPAGRRGTTTSSGGARLQRGQPARRLRRPAAEARRRSPSTG